MMYKYIISFLQYSLIHFCNKISINVTPATVYIQKLVTCVHDDADIALVCLMVYAPPLSIIIHSIYTYDRFVF